MSVRLCLKDDLSKHIILNQLILKLFFFIFIVFCIMSAQSDIGTAECTGIGWVHILIHRDPFILLLTKGKFLF